jgi:hypothetical protein
MRTQQLGFNLLGGEGEYGDPPLRQGIGADDALPPGPYAVGLTHYWGGDGHAHSSPPYTVICGDGRAIIADIQSRQIADAVADAMNKVYPS